MEAAVRRNQLRAGFALATVAMFGLSACGGDSGASSTDDTFDVVVVAPMSGQLAVFGDFTTAAYQASVDVVNARGGILGKKVNMTVLDDKGDPTTGVSVLSAYLSKNEDPDLVYPGAASPEVQGIAPFLNKKGLLSVSAAALPTMNDPEKYPLYFSVNTDNATSLDKVVEYVEEQGWSKIGLISSNDTIGDQITSGLDKATEGSDLAVDKVLFPPDALDVTAELEKLKASDPDVVVMDAIGELTLRVVQAREDIGWDIPVIGGVNSSGADFSKVDASALEGVQVVTYGVQRWVEPDQRTEAFNTFYDAVLKEEDNELAFSNFYYAVVYDPLQLVAVAAEQAKSTEPEKIAEALENLEQPADEDKPWVLFETEGFSHDNHLNVSTADDYAIVQATPLDQGFTGKPTS
jgi:branched-chain amino acid transport system substrate-binding protein